MAGCRSWGVLVTFTLLAHAATAGAQARPAPNVTDKDRAEIQELVTHYAKALSACAVEEYADLFAPVTGSFASSVRGEIVGHEKLVALVQSEPHCATTTPGRPAPGNGPTVVVTPSADRVTGIAELGNAGRYEDVYVKTPKGWRFQSRNVITRQEQEKNFSAADFIALRRLAGDDQGVFDDVFRETPVGKRLRSAGVVLTATTDGATGRAYLKNDGGHYEDVYVRGANGWRFTSRTYIAAGETASTQASAAR
ncbi:MAG TPA: nuclear transport factor 2 family protein [Vicinamibacterales bacterium]|nr:nuclear transport factor 2 family protein [Vicinamibacterales bacterium]